MAIANIPDVTAIPFVTTVSRFVINPATGQPVVINGNLIPLIGQDGPLQSRRLRAADGQRRDRAGPRHPGRPRRLRHPALRRRGAHRRRGGQHPRPRRQYNAIIASVASEHGAALVDANAFLNDVRRARHQRRRRHLQQRLPDRRPLLLRRRAPDGVRLRLHRQPLHRRHQREVRRQHRAGRPLPVRLRHQRHRQPDGRLGRGVLRPRHRDRSATRRRTASPTSSRRPRPPSRAATAGTEPRASAGRIRREGTAPPSVVIARAGAPVAISTSRSLRRSAPRDDGAVSFTACTSAC